MGDFSSMLMSHRMAKITEEGHWLVKVSVTSVQWVKLWGYIESVSSGTVGLR